MAHQVLKLLQQKHNSAVPFKQLNLFNKYLLLVTLKPTITIRFDSKWKKHYSHSTSLSYVDSQIHQHRSDADLAH